MKVILFAYRNCGYECLDYLLSIKNPPALVVIPEGEDTSERIFKSVKKLAISNQVNYFEVDKNGIDLRNTIEELQPDYGFSCYYPYIIRPEILDLFRISAFNIHGAILPDYKGALSPIWTIINEEDESGSSIHKMEEDIDSGDIVEILRCKVNYDETGFSLYSKLSELSVLLFKKYIQLAIDGKEIHGIPQVADSGNYYSRKIPFDGKINWDWPSKKIYNFCRAMYFPPFKSATSSFEDFEFEIHSIEITKTKSNNRPGEIVRKDDNGIILATTDFDIFINSKNIDLKEFEKQYNMCSGKKIFT